MEEEETKSFLALMESFSRLMENQENIFFAHKN